MRSPVFCPSGPCSSSRSLAWERLAGNFRHGRGDRPRVGSWVASEISFGLRNAAPFQKSVSIAPLLLGLGPKGFKQILEVRRHQDTRRGMFHRGSKTGDLLG